jgi:hypothetical protein
MLLNDVEDMKISVRSNDNRAKEVKARAEEELACAQLIRLGADRDLVQGMKTITDLFKMLAVSDQWFATLWRSFKTVAKLLWTSEDNGRTWGDFILLIPGSLQSFVKNGVQTCVKNILAHIRVLAPSVPLEKFRDEAEMMIIWSPSRRLSPKLKIWPTLSPRSSIFSYLLLMMKLIVRLCSARMPPSCKDMLYMLPCKEIQALWIHLYYSA